MALTVTLNGVTYSVPEPSDTGYGTGFASYLKALATAFPQLGGVATLASELDFGATYGVKAAWFKTQTANPASAGVLRLAKTDSVRWRNNANAADLALAIDAADALTFGTNYVTGNPMVDASTAAGQAIPTGATETIVVFGTATTDSDNALNTSTGRFTVPTGKGGDYLITAGIAYSTAPGGNCTATLYKNGASPRATVAVAPGIGQSIQIAAVLRLVAGDIIDIRTKHGNVGTQNLISSSLYNFLSIKRVTT